MKILLATDGSSYSRRCAELLTRIPLPPTTEVTLLTIIEQVVPKVDALVAQEEDGSFSELDKSLRQEAETLLAQEAQWLRTTRWTLHHVIRHGHAASQIIEAALELGTDLVVVGSRGLTDVKRFLMGSVSQKVVKYAPCSVLVVRPKGENSASPDDTALSQQTADSSPLRLLLAFDGSTPAKAAADLLASLPLAGYAQITVLTVLTVATTLYRQDILEQLSNRWQIYKKQMQTQLETTATALRKIVPDVTVKLIDGGSGASDEILNVAENMDADIIVLGDTGASGISRFLLGSVCARVVNHAPCSVWVVKQTPRISKTDQSS